MNNRLISGIRNLPVAMPAIFLLTLLASPTQGETINSHLRKLEFKSGYPATETVEKLYDELDFQRAVQAYLWALPMASYGAMADAHKALGADTAGQGKVRLTALVRTGSTLLRQNLDSGRCGKSGMNEHKTSSMGEKK